MEPRRTQQTEEECSLDDATRHIGNSVIVTTGALDPPTPEIVRVNEGFCRMTGHAPEEIVGKTMRFLQKPKTDRAELDRLRRHLLGGEPSENGRIVDHLKDGSEFLLDWVREYRSTTTPTLDALVGRGRSGGASLSRTAGRS